MFRCWEYQKCSAMTPERQERRKIRAAKKEKDEWQDNLDDYT